MTFCSSIEEELSDNALFGDIVTAGGRSIVISGEASPSNNFWSFSCQLQTFVFEGENKCDRGEGEHHEASIKAVKFDSILGQHIKGKQPSICILMGCGTSEP